MRALSMILLGACRTTTTSHTTHSGTPPDPYPPADVVWSMGPNSSAHYMGWSMAVHAEGPILGAPSRRVDEPGVPYVFLPSKPFAGGQPTEDWFRLENATTWDEQEDSHDLGTEVLAPGDVTGDGVDDLMAFDTYQPPAATGYVVPGPLAGRRLHADDPSILPLFGAHRGTPCGDVTGDGRTDLCLETGVVAGPVTAPVALTVSWSGRPHRHPSRRGRPGRGRAQRAPPLGPRRHSAATPRLLRARRPRPRDPRHPLVR